MWALGLGMGLCTAIPSLVLKKPVMVAWSTPGAAVLATAGLAGGFSMAEAVGAFLVCGALIALFGVTGWFERLMNRIPMAIASALLAGVLARFGLQAFRRGADGAAAGAAHAVYLPRWPGGSRRATPSWLTLAGGHCLFVRPARRDGVVARDAGAWPRRSSPCTSLHAWRAITSLALPLFVVTMASQNLPGVAAIRAAGYDMPISRLVTVTGVAMLILAPFGAFALCLSAITAAICMGREAHEDPDKRYTAAVSLRRAVCADRHLWRQPSRAC
jgi:benzoate membrane transport protein